MDALVFVAGLIVTLVTMTAVGAIWWAALRDPHADGTYHGEEPVGEDPEPQPLRRAA